MRSFLPGSPTPSSTLADKLVWVSAFMPQPFRRIQVIHVFWKEEHQPGAWGPAPPHSQGLFRALRPLRLRLSVQMVQRPPLQLRRLNLVLRGWRVFFPRRRYLPCLCACNPSVSLPPGIQSPPASDIGSTLTGFRAVDCPVRLREDDASSCLRSLKLRLAFGSELRHHWPRPKCDFIHPRQLSPFLERLVLPFSNEVILSGYEEFDSSGTDLFTTWVKMSEHEILVQHMVDVEKATSEFREAPERKHATCSHMNSSSKRFATRSIEQRLSIYNWNPRWRKKMPSNNKLQEGSLSLLWKGRSHREANCGDMALHHAAGSN